MQSEFASRCSCGFFASAQMKSTRYHGEVANSRSAGRSIARPCTAEWDSSLREILWCDLSALDRSAANIPISIIAAKLNRLGVQSNMSSSLRLPMQTVLLLLCSYFLCQPLSASSDQADAAPSTAQDSGVPEARQAGPDSSADDTEMLFPVVEGEKAGFIDKTGKIVISPRYYHAHRFSEGMAFVQPYYDPGRRRQLEILIDKTGSRVGNQMYFFTSTFAEGLAFVAIWGQSGLARQDLDMGFIDKAGKMVIPLQQYKPIIPLGPLNARPSMVAKSFSEGLAGLYDHGKWGFIDKTGKVVISPQFSYESEFKEGVAPVKDGKKWGYIDKTGKMVISPQFSDAWPFAEGLAPVKDGDRWGYIDKTGKLVIPFQYGTVYLFTEGLAAVKDHGKWGYIDKTGKMVIPPQFPVAYGFTEGLAAVKDGKRCGFIDKTGKMVISPQFSDAGMFVDGLAEVQEGNRRGYIDHAGKYVWGPTK